MHTNWEMNIADLSQRVRTVFLRKGRLSANTGFSDTNPQLHAEARQCFDLPDEAELIIVTKPDNERMSALLGDELIWVDVNGLNSIRLKDIEDVRVDFKHLVAIGDNLLTATELEVVRGDDTAIVIPVEAGNSFAGFWNALLAAIKMKNSDSP